MANYLVSRNIYHDCFTEAFRLQGHRCLRIKVYEAQGKDIAKKYTSRIYGHLYGNIFLVKNFAPNKMFPVLLNCEQKLSLG